MFMHLLFALLFLSIALPFGMYWLGRRDQKRFRNSLVINMVSFFSILLFATVFLFSSTAQAADTVSGDIVTASAFLSAALTTCFSSLGAGIATGKAAAAAIGALSENEKIMGKALIIVALAEGIAIYGLLMSFTILGRV